MIEDLVKELKKYNKIIVTGPPRAGTTISGLILAHELKYKFIDESWYDSNNPKKFMFFLGLDRKMVIHTTAFLRDLHILNLPIVLVKRPIKDILESFKNTKNFSMPIETSAGLFTCIDKEAENKMLKHYGCENGCTPEIIYKWFYEHNKDFYELNYNDLKDHKLFVRKEVRRKKFKHMKQVKEDDPNYLRNKKGVMVL